ncbi:MAG: FAD-binding oxidoreductase [Rubritepida sp.]|nr:FAD-binding oxidoreductase [Rubritepida sp.]
MTAEVIVVGGGITGLATAHALAGAGVRVRLLERGALGAMASGWTLGGVRQSGRHPAELPLAIAAVARWGELAEVLGADPGYRRRGNLRLARSGTEVAQIRALVGAQSAQGLDLEFLPDTAAVRAVAPALGEAVLAASFCPSDGHADPAMTVAAYAAAARRLGVVIEEGVEALALLEGASRVRGVRTRDAAREADAVVLATGLHAPGLLRPLGLDLPLAPQVVTVLQTAPLPPLLDQVFGVANADCAGLQEIGGRLRITTGIGDWPHAPEGWAEAMLMPTAGTLAGLIARVGALLPALEAARVARVWGGLIDLTPDALPVLDAPRPGLVVAAGFSGHGWGLGPVTGEICAALALGRLPVHDIAAFHLARFAADPARVAQPLALHG